MGRPPPESFLGTVSPVPLSLRRVLMRDPRQLLSVVVRDREHKGHNGFSKQRPESRAKPGRGIKSHNYIRARPKDARRLISIIFKSMQSLKGSQ